MADHGKKGKAKRDEANKTSFTYTSEVIMVIIRGLEHDDSTQQTIENVKRLCKERGLQGEPNESTLKQYIPDWKNTCIAFAEKLFIVQRAELVARTCDTSSQQAHHNQARDYAKKELEDFKEKKFKKLKFSVEEERLMDQIGQKYKTKKDKQARDQQIADENANFSMQQQLDVGRAAAGIRSSPILAVGSGSINATARMDADTYEDEILDGNLEQADAGNEADKDDLNYRLLGASGGGETPKTQKVVKNMVGKDLIETLANGRKAMKMSMDNATVTFKDSINIASDVVSSGITEFIAAQKQIEGDRIAAQSKADENRLKFEERIQTEKMKHDERIHQQMMDMIKILTGKQ